MVDHCEDAKGLVEEVAQRLHVRTLLKGQGQVLAVRTRLLRENFTSQITRRRPNRAAVDEDQRHARCGCQAVEFVCFCLVCIPLLTFIFSCRGAFH